MRNREQTEEKLIHAVAKVIAEQGFAKLGVNQVAKQAGVDKVLIYRYFDGLDGLLEAYAKSSNFWPSLDELLGPSNEREALKNLPFADAVSQVLLRYANALRSRPLTLEILSWETIERNALTIAFEEVREQVGLEMMAYLTETNPPQGDWQAITNLISGGIHYLAIRSRKISVYGGMDITEDDQWLRMIDAIHFLLSNLETSDGRSTE